MVRSRGGCPNCKRRKRKCDETRPECRACQTRGIQCEGYNTTLKWTNGIASRGRFARAAVPERAARDPDPTPATSSSYPPTIDDPQPRVSSISSSPASLGAQGLQIRSAPQLDTQGSQLSISSLTSSSTGDVIDPKQQLFRRFIHTGMNRLYNTDSQGWLKGHFVAMAERSPAFFNVCGAIQAYIEDGLSVSSMELVDHALQTFRSELESRHESYDASTVSAGLLICTQCVSFCTTPLLSLPIVAKRERHLASPLANCINLVTPRSTMDNISSAHGRPLSFRNGIGPPFTCS
ncbi:hypothetical protein CGRA01v4_04363 [Colletotrichum graminicola]|nr:hypothetical protein CGRA01v4_04363 [Colletotrichum graminicola]